MSSSAWFSPPVCISLHDGFTRNVSRVHDAAELLIELWPETAQHGPVYFAALRACDAFLSGNGSGDEVREAFEAAAKDAGILCDPPFDRQF